MQPLPSSCCERGIRTSDKTPIHVDSAYERESRRARLVKEGRAAVGIGSHVTSAAARLLLRARLLAAPQHGRAAVGGGPHGPSAAAHPFRSAGGLDRLLYRPEEPSDGAGPHLGRVVLVAVA